jgi:hypothetical protein
MNISSYCPETGNATLLDGRVRIIDNKNMFVDGPHCCVDDDCSYCTVPFEISFKDDQTKFNITLSNCDIPPCFERDGQVSHLSPLDYEKKPFYNIPLLAKNKGPWRTSDTNDTYEDRILESTENARLMIEVLDAPDQPPRFNVPPALVYLKEGPSSEGGGYITEDEAGKTKVFFAATDPDLDLNWEVEVVINEIKSTGYSTPETNFSSNFISIYQEPDNTPRDMGNMSIQMIDNLFAECNVTTDDDCFFDSQRYSNLLLNVKATEKVPDDWFDECGENLPCKGIPSCAYNVSDYMETISFDVTVRLQDRD